jgi:hypothetical protein
MLPRTLVCGKASCPSVSTPILVAQVSAIPLGRTPILFLLRVDKLRQAPCFSSQGHRVTIKTIANSEAIAVRLQKTCIA